MAKAIIKTLYLPKQGERTSNGNWNHIRNDALYYIVADSETNNREIKLLKEPEIFFYVAKENTVGKTPLFSIPKEDVRRVKCKYNRRKSAMAKEIGKAQEYSQHFGISDWMTRRDWFNKNIAGSPFLYGCDVDIEDFCRMSFNKTHGENIDSIKIKRAFTDIEVRVDKNPDFDPKRAANPIATIQHLDELSNTIYVMIVRDPDIPDMKEVEDNISDFAKLVQRGLNEVYEAIPKKNRVHNLKYNYNFTFVDTEEELIRNYFQMVHDTQPDFIGIWNIGFDIPFLINRAVNNYPSLSIPDILSPELPPEYRIFKFKEDYERSKQHSSMNYSRFWDTVDSSSPTQYYDQMSLFSNMRKRSLLPSYKLDSIGEDMAHVKKVDLEGMGYHIRNVIVKNFRVFLEYAIRDVVVQQLIELNANDIPKYLNMSYNTRFSHGLKVSILIKNVISEVMDAKDHILGNNVDTTGIKEHIPGAIIADPKNIHELGKGIEILGTRTHIYRYLIDFDYSSFYPSTMIVYNIMKNKVYGRGMSVTTDLPSLLDPNVKEPYIISTGQELNQHLQTLDTSIFDVGTKYFGLPTMDEIIKDLDTELTKRANLTESKV